ncbi:MAG TPA: hypothetical protein VGY48_32475, partial [Vicinamibacterales bacterium]|nr:hypothetical protein [Vicinamibacterales bacterium]
RCLTRFWNDIFSSVNPDHEVVRQRWQQASHFTRRRVSRRLDFTTLGLGKVVTISEIKLNSHVVRATRTAHDDNEEPQAPPVPQGHLLAFSANSVTDCRRPAIERTPLVLESRDLSSDASAGIAVTGSAKSKNGYYLPVDWRTPKTYARWSGKGRDAGVLVVCNKPCGAEKDVTTLILAGYSGFATQDMATDVVADGQRIETRDVQPGHPVTRLLAARYKKVWVPAQEKDRQETAYADRQALGIAEGQGDHASRRA